MKTSSNASHGGCFSPANFCTKTPKTFLIMVLLLAGFMIAHAQSDTTFVDSVLHKVPRAQASFYKLDTKDTNDSTRLITRVYDMQGHLRSEIPILCIKEPGATKLKKVWDGVMKQWNEAGQLTTQTEYSRNKKNGQSILYWPDGNIKIKSSYTDGKCSNDECYDKEGKEVDCATLHALPHFPTGDAGLLDIIAHNLRYPRVDQEKRIEGTVKVQFIVTEEGKLKNIHVIQSVSPTADAEACRVVALTSPWVPALECGVPVVALFTLPIRFKLN